VNIKPLTVSDFGIRLAWLDDAGDMETHIAPHRLEKPTANGSRIARHAVWLLQGRSGTYYPDGYLASLCTRQPLNSWRAV
jgi:hypothetical protein